MHFLIRLECKTQTPYQAVEERMVFWGICMLPCWGNWCQTLVRGAGLYYFCELWGLVRSGQVCCRVVREGISRDLLG